MEASTKSFSFFTTLVTGRRQGFSSPRWVSLIPGTSQISDRSYLEAMRSIDRAILNSL
jgi:hypothetical protein